MNSKALLKAIFFLRKSLTKISVQTQLKAVITQTMHTPQPLPLSLEPAIQALQCAAQETGLQ